MHSQILQKAGSHLVRSFLVRSLVIGSTLVAAVSAPSFAAPRAGYFTATQDDVPYGEVPRQLVVIQKPMDQSSGASTTIAPTARNGLPRSLSIQASGGGGAPEVSLPQLVFVPANAQSVGGELINLIPSSALQIREVRSNTGYLDQTDKNVINFSF